VGKGYVRYVHAYGVGVRVEGATAPVVHRFLARLPALSNARAPAPRRVESRFELETRRRGRRDVLYLRQDERVLFRSSKQEAVLDAGASALELLVAERSPTRTFIHAGVVAWRNRAIVLPGYSRAGKSTLVAALLRAGATYYSDEFAILDDRGFVHPYARPLLLRAGRRMGSRRRPRRIGKRPLPVGLVWMARYTPRSAPAPRVLDGGEAVVQLLRHTVSARRQPAASLDRLGRMVAGARVWMGPRGEAVQAAKGVLSSLWREIDAPARATKGSSRSPR
jgi:hypothetical protein